MPDKVIDIPGVGPIAFPDSMSDADMNAAASKLYREANPEHPPPDPKHSWVQTAKDWLPTAGDLVTGAVKGLVHSGQTLASYPVLPGGISSEDIGNAIGNIVGGTTGQARYGTQAQPVSKEQARQATAYTNLPQRVGGAIETAAEMVLPGRTAVETIPTKARAGQMLESVKQAAKDVPVDLSAAGDVALRIQELAERGGSMPMAVRKFLIRVTDPNKPAMLYPESFDFRSNLSRLSANDYNRMSPVVAREVADLSAKLNKANADAAAVVGKGADHIRAMNDYGTAVRVRDFYDTVLRGMAQGIPRAVPYGIAGSSAYLTKKLFDLFGESK